MNTSKFVLAAYGKEGDFIGYTHMCGHNSEVHSTGHRTECTIFKHYEDNTVSWNGHKPIPMKEFQSLFDDDPFSHVYKFFDSYDDLYRADDPYNEDDEEDEDEDDEE